MFLKSFQQYKNVQKYSTYRREPFFELAQKYMSKDSDLKILDIGAGNGFFAEYLKLNAKYKNLYLLDNNPETVKVLKSKYKNVIEHKIPGKIPFPDCFFDFIHCSHLVEHLYYQQCYSFLKEINRTLKPGGILVISAPYFCPDFYDDFSHIKPYHPAIFLNYLVHGVKENVDRQLISDNYTKLNLVFRYTIATPKEYVGSENRALNIIFFLWRKLKSTLKIKVYQKSGFTLVLKKGNELK